MLGRWPAVQPVAGWFEGDVNVNGVGVIFGGTWVASDASLKTNVAPLADGLDIIAQLQPKSYEYLTSDFPGVAFPTGGQAGFMAQELEAVLPHLVKEVKFTAQYDSVGVVTQPGFEYKALNYDGIIPYLVQAINEQQAQITAMQQALDACCVGGTDGGLFQGQGNNTGLGTQDLSRMANEDLLTIAPNPFEERTTISYRAAAPGRVMLRVSDGRGQHIDTLRDAMQDAGAYTYEWITMHLAPGMYTVTLLLDGQVLVERAVKLGR